MRLRVLMEPRRGATYEQILALSRAAEEAGLDGFFRGDHYLGIDAGGPAEKKAFFQSNAERVFRL